MKPHLVGMFQLESIRLNVQRHALLLCSRGVGPGCNTREIADKLIDLKAELDDLALREHELDQQRVWVQQSIKNVTDDSNNSPYPCSSRSKSVSPVL